MAASCARSTSLSSCSLAAKGLGFRGLGFRVLEGVGRESADYGLGFRVWGPRLAISRRAT